MNRAFLLPLFCILAKNFVYAQQVDSSQRLILSYNTILLERNIQHQFFQFPSFQKPSLLDLMTLDVLKEKGIFLQAKSTPYIHKYLPVANDSTAVKEILFSKIPYESRTY